MKKKLLVLLFSLASLGLVSCGGGNDVASSGTKSAPVNAQMTIGNSISAYCTFIASGVICANLDPNQALFFDFTSKLSYGGVNSLTIGGTKFSTNLSMPLRGDQYISEQIVGPLSSVNLEGLTSPLEFTFFVDATNKDALLKLISAGVPDTAVSINFAAVSYDPVAKLYFTGFWTNASTVSGNVVKSATETYLKVETTPYTGISSPVLYEAHLRISPPANSCLTLYAQSSNTNKWAVPWGSCKP